MASTKEIERRVPSHKGIYTPIGPKQVFDFKFKTQAPPGLKKSFSSSDLQSMSPEEKLKLEDAKNTKPTFLESIGVPSLGMKKSVSLSSLDRLASKVVCHEDLIRLSHSFKSLRSSYPGLGLGSSSFNKMALPGMSACYANDCKHITHYISPDGRRFRRTPVPHYIESEKPPICQECSKSHSVYYSCRGMDCFVCFSHLHFTSDCPFLSYLPQDSQFDSTQYMVICQFGHYFDVDRWRCINCSGREAKLRRMICSICLGEDHTFFDCPNDVVSAAELKSEWEKMRANSILKEV